MELRTSKGFVDKATSRAAKAVEGNFRRKFVLEHPLADFADDYCLELAACWLLTSERLFKDSKADFLITVLRKRPENERDLLFTEAVLSQLIDNMLETL